MKSLHPYSLLIDKAIIHPYHSLHNKFVLVQRNYNILFRCKNVYFLIKNCENLADIEHD